MVERFRDEVGDWRMCVLSPFGSRVHAPWALAIEQRLTDRLGPGAQVLWSDDGIVVRLPEAVDRIPVEDLLFDPQKIENEVVRVLPGARRAVLGLGRHRGAGPRRAAALHGRR